MVSRALFIVAIFAGALKAGDPDIHTIQGTIAAVYPEAAKKGDSVGSVDVVGDRRTLTLLITDMTKLEKVVGKERRPCTFADLKKGDKVEADYNPVIFPSDPPQAGAYRVVVVTQPK
jgi:hypothetical protein